MAMERVTLNSRIQTAMSKTEMESKTLQTQIVTKQQSLNRLSSDSKKTSEEKEKEELSFEYKKTPYFKVSFLLLLLLFFFAILTLPCGIGFSSCGMQA